jgi:hypothetical protein
MANPLYISGYSRKAGKVYLTVVGHGLTAANNGNTLTIVGCSDPSFNVVTTIDHVIVPNTIVFNQPGVNDQHAEKVGGACAIG